MSQWIVISNYLTGVFSLTGHPGINFAFLKMFENIAKAGFPLPLPHHGLDFFHAWTDFTNHELLYSPFQKFYSLSLFLIMKQQSVSEKADFLNHSKFLVIQCLYSER